MSVGKNKIMVTERKLVAVKVENDMNSEFSGYLSRYCSEDEIPSKYAIKAMS